MCIRDSFSIVDVHFLVIPTEQHSSIIRERDQSATRSSKHTNSASAARVTPKFVSTIASKDTLATPKFVIKRLPNQRSKPAAISAE